jgi:hypothetical protein
LNKDEQAESFAEFFRRKVEDIVKDVKISKDVYNGKKKIFQTHQPKQIMMEEVLDILVSFKQEMLRTRWYTTDNPPAWSIRTCWNINISTESNISRKISPQTMEDRQNSPFTQKRKKRQDRKLPTNQQLIGFE